MDRNRLLDIGWSLATNLFVLAGVALWDWPPGNVFVLFWIENVVLGVVTVVRIRTAAGTSQGVERPPRAGFFVMHYGLFALVHMVFVMMIATRAGVSWTWWAMGLPTVLLTIRYAADLLTGWFLGGQRFRVTPGEAFSSPYGRLVVLHTATIIGFFLLRPGSSRHRGWVGIFDPVRDWFAAQGYTVTDGALVVLILVAIKTVTDLRALGGFGAVGLRLGRA